MSNSDGTPSAPAATFTGSRDEELLRLLARQARWVPLPVFCGGLLIFALAYDAVPLPWPVLWLGTVICLLVLRFLVLGWLPHRTEVPGTTRLRIAVLLSGLNGITHGSAVAFFPFLVEFERFIAFMVILAFCAGAVSSTAGYRPIFLAYIVPTIVPLALVWGVNAGGDIEWYHVFVALLTLLYGLVLVRLAYDAFRLFRESFEIRLGHVELNKRLERALEESRVANAAKMRFLAVASHDLRQPVYALALFSNSLSRRPLDERSREIAEHIDTAVDALSVQLDSLLDISKLDAGIVKPNAAPFVLDRLLERLLESFKPLADMKGLALAVSCPANLVVMTDETLLEQIVRNLLGNAVKYTEAGGVSVTAAEDGERLVLLTIADTGRGIPAEAQPHVFEEFYQVDNPGRDRSRGLGLGLAITKRLVELLRIPLSMSSAPGRGTTFALQLERVAWASPTPRPAAPIELERLNVLVVDDEPEVLHGTRLLLEDLGCRVATAESTAEALEAAQAVRPDIVLSDFRLRGEDNGLLTVRRLRELFPALPAIVLTGDSGPERLREAHQAGVMLLHKPVRPEKLAAAINEIYGAARAAEGVTVVNR